MNLMLNMKDINKTKSEKTHIFAKTCLYDAVGSLTVMPSLFPHVL